jgi:hypothetical protein
MLTDNQINEIRNILIATTGCVSRSYIYESLQKTSYPTDMELYKFKIELSELINGKKIDGYIVKPGRNGGIVRQEKVEHITLHCSRGTVIGSVYGSQLDKFLSNVKEV